MSERLTPERLAELRRIAEAATKGPWRVNKYGSIGAGELGIAPVIANVEPFWSKEEREKYGDHGDNARHIAAFDPTTALELLDALAAARAEAERYRQQYEALRAAVEGVAERIGEAADGTYKAWQNDARDYLQGRAHAMEHAERMVRRILSDACPYCSAPMEDDPGRYPSGDVDMAWTCGTWRMIDGVTFRSDGCGAREVADDAVAR